ncbi:MAG: MYXO-CTERM sorting domain-containing protein, partial [Sandaracinaceae bacterium]
SRAPTAALRSPAPTAASPGADGGAGEETVMGDCACRAAPGKPSRWPVGLALGSVLLALRTRRRRSRRAP